MKAEKVGEQDVKFTFDQPGNRELPVIVGQLYVLPKHWWEGTDKDGKKRDIGATTLEPPLGSGPYRIKDFIAGRTLVLERVKDYWGAKLPVNIGQNNFDETALRILPRQHRRARGLQGRSGRLDHREQREAVGDGLRLPGRAREARRPRGIPDALSGRMQGFVFNLRRDLFKDARFRRAFNYAYDFEEMNKQLFYGQYKRIKSYFEGTELACEGLPQGKELEILESVRDKVPPRCSRPPTPIPSTAIRRTCATIAAKRCVCSRRPASRSRTRSWSIQRQASHGRVSWCRTRAASGWSFLQAGAGSAWHQRVGSLRRQRAVPEPPAQLRLRHHHRRVGPVAVAGQRATRLLGLEGGRSAGLEQLRRDQESGDR